MESAQDFVDEHSRDKCINCEHHGFFMECKGDETALLFAKVSGKMYCWEESKTININEKSCEKFEACKTIANDKVIDTIEDFYKEQIRVLEKMMSDFLLKKIKLDVLEARYHAYCCLRDM
jgi:chloramphenicol O-acetyltransferase